MTLRGRVRIFRRRFSLRPTSISNSFGKLFTVPTDGQIYTQPLYVANLAIAGGTHNVVFVGSMFNTLYAIDADNGTVYWTQNFGSEIIAEDVENDQNISWYTGIGILGTPVIDPNTNIMYFVSGSQPADGAQVYAYYLNAVEIATGLPVSGSPVNITATYSTADLTTPLVFNAKTQNQRAGLAHCQWERLHLLRLAPGHNALHRLGDGLQRVDAGPGRSLRNHDDRLGGRDLDVRTGSSDR